MILDCDMAGVIAAMRGTPKPRRLKVSRPEVFVPPTPKPTVDPLDPAWNRYFSELSEIDDWRDEW